MPDNVVRHRPFWSFSILKTEKWLGEMAASGLIFVETDFKGKFVFKEENPQKLSFCFVYNKFDTSKRIAKTNKKEWHRVAHKNKWGLYQSISCSNKNIPNRRGLYLRNNSLLCLYAFSSSAILLILMMLTFLAISLNRVNYDYESIFRMILISIGAFGIIILSNFIFYINMTMVNGRILENKHDETFIQKEYKHFISNKTFEKWLEKILVKDGEIIKCFKVIWVNTPAQIENWLLKMQSHNYNFYKLSKHGTVFYFTKGVSVKNNYSVISGDSEILSACINSGWKLVFCSTKNYRNKNIIAIISKPFEDKKELPFHERSQAEKSAYNIFISYIVPYALALIFLLLLLIITAVAKLNTALSITILVFGLFDIYLVIRELIYFLKAKFKQFNCQNKD